MPRGPFRGERISVVDDHDQLIGSVPLCRHDDLLRCLRLPFLPRSGNGSDQVSPARSRGQKALGNPWRGMLKLRSLDPGLTGWMLEGSAGEKLARRGPCSSAGFAGAIDSWGAASEGGRSPPRSFLKETQRGRSAGEEAGQAGLQALRSRV